VQAPRQEARVRQDRSVPEVAVVTAARLSHTDDITLRQRRYVLTQSVRIVCVVAAALLPVPLIWKGVFMLGAVALPWFGVVMANAGPTVGRQKKTSLLEAPAVEQPVRIAIEPGRVIDQD
jgi:hypothetical protein